MISCIQYLSELRNHNRRIQELSRGIDIFNRNENHLNVLKSEYSAAERELSLLDDKWRQQYIPAIERAQALRKELYMARNQPGQFEETVKNELMNLSTFEALKKIAGLKTPYLNHEMHPANGLADDDVDACQEERADGAKNDTASEASVIMDLTVSHRAWTLSGAMECVHRLEAQHKEIGEKMRSLGSRTCRVTAQLHSLQSKVQEYKNAMKSPPHALYSHLEAELVPLKTKAYRNLLQSRIGSFATHSTRSDSKRANLLTGTVNKRHGQKFDASQLERSYSALTSDSISSWSASVTSSLTELSLADDNFFEDTKQSLDKAAAHWPAAPAAGPRSCLG